MIYWEIIMELNKIMAALDAMHKEFGVIIRKDSKGHKSTYASRSQIIETVSKMTSKHGLKFFQELCHIGEKQALKTIVVHIESGQYISSVSTLTPADNPQSNDQAFGGSCTYHSRYHIMLLLGLAAEDDEADNDGEVASKGNTISDKQAGLLRFKLQNNKEKELAILKRLNISRLEEMPWSKFSEVLDYASK